MENVYYDSFRSNFDLKHNGRIFQAQVGSPCFEFCKLLAEGKENEIVDIQVQVFPPSLPSKENYEWRELRKLCDKKMALDVFIERKLRAPELEGARFLVNASVANVELSRVLFFEWFTMLATLQDDMFIDFVKDEVKLKKIKERSLKRGRSDADDESVPAESLLDSDIDEETFQRIVDNASEVDCDRTISYNKKSKRFQA